MLSRFFPKHFYSLQGRIVVVSAALSCLFAVLSFIGALKLPTTIEDIAVIGDRGINLYLTFITCSGVIFAYALTSSALRNVFFVIQLFVLSGAVGSLFPSSHPIVARLVRWGRPQAEIRLGSLTLKEKCDISEADAACPHPDIGHIVISKDNFQAIIHFNAWSADFKLLLEKTVKGEVVCILWPLIFKDLHLPLSVFVQKPLSRALPPVSGYQRTFSGQRFWLDPQAAHILLATRQLTIKPVLAGAAQETFLAFRDYRIPVTNRRDVYIYNGKTHTLPYDGIFPLMFMFESPIGAPLALFL